MQVGTVDDDLSVEAARAEERRVEHVRPVRRGEKDDALVRLEPVHLDEKLVQRLLALVVSAAETGASHPTDGVHLVDEDDARGVGLALLEEVTNAGGADADEHLDEVGPADRQERDLGLAGYRAGEKRLARAGRSHEERALRDLAAEPLELVRLAQELDDLLTAPASPLEGPRRRRT